MKRTHLAVLIVFGVLCVLASATTKGSKPSSKSSPPEASGERAFKANCSRCHYAPDTLNPRITGTVIRHMRVRANLSAADERAILHYLNP